MSSNKPTEIEFTDRVATVECLWGISDRLRSAAAEPVLRQWLDDPMRAVWDTERGRAIEQAACELAISHGNFELFDIPAPGDWRCGMLPPPLAIPAIRGGIARAVRLMQNIDAWESRWLECAEPAIQHEMVTSLLEQVMDLRAASLGIHGVASDKTATDLAEDAVACPNRESLPLSSWLEVFQQAITDVEEMLDERSGPISVIAETNWALNLETTLPAASWQPRPWWLTDQALVLWKDFVAGQEDAIDFQRSMLETRLHEAAVDAPQTAELAAAFAGPSHAQALYRQFDGTIMGLSVELQIEVSSALGEVVPANKPLSDVPKDYTVKMGVIVSSDHMEAPPQLEDDQRWRLRIGLFITDFVCTKRLGMNDTLFANHTCTVEELRAGWFDGKFCPAYFRRIA